MCNATDKTSNLPGGRPSFPKRAVITAGMPYGNKPLHFGHIGAVFVHADVFARFLRDRLGEENVIFVSGTDCYGSSIDEGYRKAREEGSFDGELVDYVRKNHLEQKHTLDQYQISLNLFGASALGDTGEVHRAYSQELFLQLYASGYLKVSHTEQFFDEEKNMFLNGRQVVGRCPIQGCKSDFAYADECALGHQYNPQSLIHPISSLSGKAPVLRPVYNWYFDLPAFHDAIEAHVDRIAGDSITRDSMVGTIREFLKNPQIYVKKENIPQVETLRSELPAFQLMSEENKTSDVLSFADLADCDKACAVLEAHQIRYRTGKTLVPFRISGNAKWGVPVPEKDGVSGLTFWVWPESLWAPISFTKTYLASQDNAHPRWEQWWNSKDATVYQFIGEDNIYFYAVAETGLFLALHQNPSELGAPQEGSLQMPRIIANHHMLLGKKKASSSGEIKPPKADELLDYYSVEQLRMHFINASLGERSVGFEPKTALTKGETKEFDPVLTEGNLLTNVFNRIVRSCFYSVQKYCDGKLPVGEVSPQVKAAAEKLIVAYENYMHDCRFDQIFELLNIYLRDANKDWARISKEADTQEDSSLRCQLLVDTFHVVRVATALTHPIAPEGCEMIREYLGADARLWDWNYIFEPLTSLLPDAENHAIRFLEPRVDFFKKHMAEFSQK